MPNGFLDRCIFTPAAGGLGDWVVSAAVPGYLTPAQANAVDGVTYGYSAQTLDSSGNITAWEVGEGAWSASTSTLPRTNVEFSSNGNAKVNFAAVPNVLVCPLADQLTSSSGANPTATAGPAAVDGSATTFMRSDAAPAVQKASDSQFGIVEVDGTTIMASGGVISAAIGSGLVVGPGGTPTPITNGTPGYALTVGASNELEEAPIRTIATGNIDFHVAPTGSDVTGDGSSGNPWATNQHAVNVAANNYDWQNTYYFRILNADGTCNDAGNIDLPNIPSVNTYASNGCQIIGNDITPDNVVLSGYFQLEAGAQWFVQGFKLTNAYAAFVMQPGCTVSPDQINFAANYSQGAFVVYGGFINADAGTFYISSAMSYFIWNYFGSSADAYFDFDSSTITFQNNPAFGAFLLFTNSGFTFNNGQFINASTVVGTKVIFNGGTPYLVLTNGTADGAPLTRANFPGTDVMEYANGSNGLVSSDPCLFSDLPGANQNPGLSVSISDCNSNTWSAVAGGGGAYPAQIWADGPNAAWRVAVVGSAVVTGATLLIQKMNSGINSGSPCPSTTVDAPAGSLIVAVVGAVSAAPATITGLSDSAGNTYTQAVQTAGGSSAYFNCSLWYCSNTPNDLPIGGTFTATMSSGKYIIAAAVASAINGLDQTSTNSAGTGTGVSVSTGALAQAHEIVFGVSYPSSAIGAFTEDAGFTSLVPAQAAAGFGDLAFKVVNVTTAVTYNPTWAIGSDSTACIASFKY